MLQPISMLDDIKVREWPNNAYIFFFNQQEFSHEIHLKGNRWVNPGNPPGTWSPWRPAFINILLGPPYRPTHKHSPTPSCSLTVHSPERGPQFCAYKTAWNNAESYPWHWWQWTTPSDPLLLWSFHSLQNYSWQPLLIKRFTVCCIDQKVIKIAIICHILL